jgi:hypothetical protein
MHSLLLLFMLLLLMLLFLLLLLLLWLLLLLLLLLLLPLLLLLLLIVAQCTGCVRCTGAWASGEPATASAPRPSRAAVQRGRGLHFARSGRSGRQGGARWAVAADGHQVPRACISFDFVVAVAFFFE